MAARLESRRRSGFLSAVGSGIAFAVASLIIRAVEGSWNALAWGFGVAGLAIILIALIGFAVLRRRSPDN